MISVIIVNYFSAHLTERAVRSVFREGEDIEVIVIDNTATPDEKERLCGLLRAHDIKLFFNHDNVGFAKANNQAFSISRGEYIFLLNPDAFVVPPCLGVLRNFLENNPDTGSASPMVYWDDEMRFLFPHYTYPSPLRDLCSKLSQLSLNFASFYSLYERRNNLELWKASLPIRVKNLHGGVVMLRRSSVDRAGGLFDERFFLFYEDTDFFLRLRKSRNKLYIVPVAKAVHNYNHKIQKLDRMAETLGLFYEKHYSQSLLRKAVGLIPYYTSGVTLVDCGCWNVPPSFPVPEKLRKGYLFEWSPSPLFVPSIGCFGSGDVFVLSGQVWDFLDPGAYYSRMTNPEKTLLSMETLRWIKNT